VGSLTVKDLPLPGPKLVVTTRFEDDRGYFQETWNHRDFVDAVGFDVEFVQDNESMSRAVGTVRGLHYQLPPSTQGKLVRVVSGRLWDVVVDLRTGSPNYGRHTGVELDPHDGYQLWIPGGFAHGFVTLEPDTVIAYKVTDFHDPGAERCVNWLDARLAIDWPVDIDAAVLSDRDRSAPDLDQLERDGHVF
jgi:dTDP-4-dehydrorhamnose 3,5-epimerase